MGQQHVIRLEYRVKAPEISSINDNSRSDSDLNYDPDTDSDSKSEVEPEIGEDKFYDADESTSSDDKVDTVSLTSLYLDIKEQNKLVV